MRGVFVENHDSFSWNVIELLPVEAGALSVLSAREAPRALDGADFLVIGPGPMDPVRAGLLEVVQQAAQRAIPTLGICLGHQALGLAFGASLVRSPPVHGQTARLHFGPSRWLGEVGGELEVMRYHSLALRNVAPPLEVIAALPDGTPMAIEHRALPMVGLQFHPDSWATPRGRELVARFFANFFEVPRRREVAAKTPRPAPLAETEAPALVLSSLQGRRDFALLAPGFSNGPDWTLLTDLEPGGDSLLLSEAEGRAPRWFSGRRQRVTLLNDVAPRVYAPSLEREAFAAGVETIRAAVARGDVYQVNLTQRVALGACAGSELLSTLCARGVPRFAAWLHVSGVGELVSASPELLFELEGDTLRAEPMKGTAGPGGRAQLEASAKDAAELAMITDLVRDDLQRVCEAGSVHVTSARRFVELPYAVQTVSDVEGRLQASRSVEDVVVRLHPGGSVTGAPRQAALELISQLERTPRSFYCGTLGLKTGELTRAALLIRTAFHGAAGGEWLYGVGGGITWASNAADELAELEVKLGALRGAR